MSATDNSGSAAASTVDPAADISGSGGALNRTTSEDTEDGAAPSLGAVGGGSSGGGGGEGATSWLGQPKPKESSYKVGWGWIFDTRCVSRAPRA